MLLLHKCTLVRVESGSGVAVPVDGLRCTAPSTLSLPHVIHVPPALPFVCYGQLVFVVLVNLSYQYPFVKSTHYCPKPAVEFTWQSHAAT